MSSSFKIPLSFLIRSTKTSKTLLFPFLFKNPRKTLIPFPIPPKSLSPSWSCSRCTFITPNPKSQISQSPPPISSSSNEEEQSNCGTRNSNFRLEDDELEMGSSIVSNGKRKIEDDCVDLGGSRDIIKSVDKASVASDETRPKADLTTLKILSYNVWFAESIELRIRMRAIGDIIRSHSPNIICLQEVTPNIYAILQRSVWWKSYKCSLSFDKAITRPYFCMQLSKLPVKSYSIKQFSYSAMGRELCIAEVVAPGDAPLVVATTHLESPCPGPPKWDQMYSKEWVQQAKEAVEFLEKHPNAIFCGDMNWDDKLDGEFPLPDGWIDAWTELNPKEMGWTYDTKANAMLSGNWKLQKRLDRFLVGLRDFRVERIKMVGTEPIPGVTYLKQKKGGKELELPVLPSDHFGLLLTISAR